MAERGKPLAFHIRETLKRLRPGLPLRKLAKEAGVSVNTARKYTGSLTQNYSNGTENR